MTTQQTDTSSEVTRLAAELRRLREKAGLSFTELGERTPYSRSAWQRYLTAKVLPPWPAARDLCRLAGEPEPRLRALWELAESASRGRGAVMADPLEPQPEAGAGRRESGTEGRPEPERQDREPETEPEPGSRSAAARKGRTRLYVAVAAIAALALAAAGIYVLRDTGGPGGTPNRSVTGPFSVSCTSGSCDPTCHGAACTGQDPQLTLCGVQGVPLIEDETPGGVDVDIRYSPRCQSAWARFWNTRVGDTLTLTAPGQPAQAVRVADPRAEDTFTYTPLVFVAGSSSTLKVCVSSGSGAPDCFTASTAS